MRTFVIALLVSFATVQAAQAQQRQRDFSMPLEESLRQPSTPTVNTIRPATPYTPGNDSFYDDEDDRNSQYPISAPGTAKHYMEGYCADLGMLNQNSPVQACIAERKNASCSQFMRQPRDVRQVLNLAIDCAYAQSEGVDEYGNSAIKLPADCDSVSDMRLRLLKKYNGDQDSTDALTMLPDTVLTETASCITGANRR